MKDGAIPVNEKSVSATACMVCTSISATACMVCPQIDWCGVVISVTCDQVTGLFVQELALLSRPMGLSYYLYFS